MEIKAAGWMEDYKAYVTLLLHRRENGCLVWTLLGYKNYKFNASGYAKLSKEAIDRFISDQRVDQDVWIAKKTQMKYEDGDII